MPRHVLRRGSLQLEFPLWHPAGQVLQVQLESGTIPLAGRRCRFSQSRPLLEFWFITSKSAALEAADQQ